MEIRLIGDPVLRKRAKKVEKIDENLKNVIDEMFSTMYLYDGVGLAAPQVGISLRLFIMDSREENEKGKKVVINPEIIEFLGEEVSFEEGCLSIPDIFEDVVRPEGVKVRYQDLSGNNIEEELHGYQARIFQHETDHLDGILFTDKLPIVKKALLKKELNKLIEKGKKRALELGDTVKL
ncbi:peptide deformylase [Petrotoga mexicana DSM 14811]|jgi:peptide deformylase|uniref:Peptide deformylase n=1 Tax=Petrotoga mexicana DSM 14811 TaxID=1122954 RepID=A0A2K1PAD6_9BACT|nr:peptide deformylase [Petrotoga mexicana]PNR99754.1 peptide deformylase [Petrotoga mexicana DSM 14811]